MLTLYPVKAHLLASKTNEWTDNFIRGVIMKKLINSLFFLLALH